MRYRVAKHRRGFVCVIYYEDGSRRRVALKATDKFQATTEAARVAGVLRTAEPKQRLTVGEVVNAYFEQSEALWVSVERHHWKSAAPAFAHLPVEAVNERACREYAASSPSKPGTIRKHLSIIRAALRWGARKNICPPVPDIWLPQAPPPKDRRLTREEAENLRRSCVMPHVRLFVEVALGTGGRSGAILSLRWGMVDLGQRRIRFCGSEKQKSRAQAVPINETLHQALTEAKEGAMTDYVIEWAGQPVKSIKRGFREAVKRAGLGADVTPHVLRHTAASWMAEAGVPMSEIAAVLGHRDSRTTERIYAKMSPEYLQKAVRALG